MKYPIVLLTTITCLTILLTSCTNKKEIERLTSLNDKLQNENEELKADLQAARATSSRVDFLAAELEGIKARMITNYGNMEFEFFPKVAPITVFNFVSRAESGFYNNAQFHRVIKDFMIQAGDPNSKDNDPFNDGQGGPAVNIPHEFNNIKHEPGVLSMARIADVSAGAGSQFFIMHGTRPQLDHQYTAFGKITKGMDVVDKIANVQTNQKDPRLRDRPIKPVVISRIEIFR